MNFEESLQDVAIRERQLEAHILRSTDYLKRANQDLKRHITTLYLAIALLFVFQAVFAVHAFNLLPSSVVILITVTSFLAIVNCLLLIKTKTWLRRLNEAWLAPQEKVVLEALKSQRSELIARQPRQRNGSENAGLN